MMVPDEAAQWAEWRRYAFDAARFAREFLQWNPDPAQEAILETFRDRVILNWGRQSGKSTLAATKMVHTAVTTGGTLSVWISAHKEHTAEVFLKIEGYLERLGIQAKRQRGKELAMVLPNGSRFLGLAARDVSVRSYTAHLLIIDEAAQVKDSVYQAVTPLLALHEGTLWVLGTPRGKIGEFYEIWAHGEAAEWLKSERKTADTGRVSERFLESERRRMGDALMRREYECQFDEDGRRLLQSGAVDALFDGSEEEE